MRRLFYAIVASLLVRPELRRWRRQGARPRLWWRDDDACSLTPALDRLIAAAGERPLSLAVVPTGAGLVALAERLRAPNLSIGQHGIDHVNRAKGAVRSEYPPETSEDDISTAIGMGRARLIESGMTPLFYTPPWNAVQDNLPDVLRRLGYQILSAGAAPIPAARGLVLMGAEVDVIRWKGAPRFRGTYKVLRALGKILRERRRQGEPYRPIGLLTHHLDHDEATWNFLDWLLVYADARFEWTTPPSSAPSA